MRFFTISTSPNSSAASLIHRIQRQLFSSKIGSNSKSLYRKISQLGDPNVSVTPVLDGWVNGGNYVDKQELQRIVEELRFYKRFKHALEVSLWMTNERRFPMSFYDAAVRLKLIFKVFGLERAEDYFNKIPENKKSFSVYLALLNCYMLVKSVDKAESIMQKARDLGYASKPIWYNLMMNLHYRVGDMKKIHDLLTEMEVKGIPHDQFTQSICLSVCAWASDSIGMDKIVATMESDKLAIPHWKTYVTAIQGYLRMGLNDRALPMLTKLEGQLKSPRDKTFVFTILLDLYADIGNKDELHRLWNEFKLTNKIGNKVYLSMIRALVKFNDVEGAERIFKEWELSGLEIDFRVPNILIDSYCTDGLLKKAEDLIAKGISEGGSPLMTTWILLAGGYLRKNQVPKSVEALKKAVSVCTPKFKNQLTTCLDFLETRAYVEKEEEFTKLIKMEGISLTAIFDKLSNFINNGQLRSVPPC
ncbi:pentatricopeptide repeat-containing protein At2g20710, mitochondrial-like [Primulina tabacum]|uniref:pentatricopeptide repeat-containing protein At2g20710, mitochondrial-like n=1 Tax=Primulina tabacum TaxID=48773 RepID=UPI003F5905CB